MGSVRLCEERTLLKILHIHTYKCYALQVVPSMIYTIYHNSTICYAHLVYDPFNLPSASRNRNVIYDNISFVISHFLFLWGCVYVYSILYMSSLTIISTTKFGICNLYTLLLHTIRLSTEHTHFLLQRTNHPDCCRKNADLLHKHIRNNISTHRKK